MRRAGVAKGPAALMGVDPHAGHRIEAAVAAASTQTPSPRNLPASSEGAKARLSTSPRHGAFAKTTVDGTPLTLWVSYPERRDNAPVVIVLYALAVSMTGFEVLPVSSRPMGALALCGSAYRANGGGREALSRTNHVDKAIGTRSRERKSSHSCTRSATKG